jgi:hypothetical protein
MSVLTSPFKLDYINIGLILLSCLLAFFIPFELFLFAYGVLGPLHYMTEISWLHEKNYYTKDRRDVILLVVISFFLTILFVLHNHYPHVMSKYLSGDQEFKINARLTMLAFGSACFFAFIRKPVIKLIGIVLLILMILVVEKPLVFFAMFIPTLVHVYLFTSLFMLYGALKQKSKPGYLSVLVHFVCPILLFYLFPSFNTSSADGIDTYMKSEFSGLNQFIYGTYFDDAAPGTYTRDSFMAMVFNSKVGIAIMRFIAYAYTYHYLNWFTKTEVIKWHKMPKSRSIVIAVCWVASVALYAINYSLGFQWLFLLSFMHVLLEFPLNFVSFVGIFSELGLKKLMPAK